MILDYFLILVYIMLGLGIDLGLILIFFIALMASICHWSGISGDIEMCRESGAKPGKRFNRVYYLGIGIVCVVALAIHYTVGMPGRHLYEFLIKSCLN